MEIREFQESDLAAIVELSLRAWDPVFASLREVLGDPIFFRLKPDWKVAQAEEVKVSCTSEERDAFVAVIDGRPVGFVTVALNAFNEGMGGHRDHRGGSRVSAAGHRLATHEICA